MIKTMARIRYSKMTGQVIYSVMSCKNQGKLHLLKIKTMKECAQIQDLKYKLSLQKHMLLLLIKHYRDISLKQVVMFTIQIKNLK